MKKPYPLIVCLLLALATVMNLQARDVSSITGDTIGSAQTICNNTIPAALTGSVPGGGIGVYSYQWQTSTTSAITGFASIGGATGQGYSPAALTVTRWYRRIVKSGIEFDTTAALQITVTPAISHASNTITASQTICYATTPSAYVGSNPTGGNGIYSYLWQLSTDNATWVDIANTNTIDYHPNVSYTGYYYRRIVYSGGCSDASASIKLTVTPTITNNTITADQSICSGQTPLGLIGSTPTGGTGAFTYTWQSSTTSATTGFATAAGTANGKNYNPATQTQTTWYRRMLTSGGCTDISATVQVTVVTTIPGDPTIFGNNVWNAYAYSDASFTTYAGYYTENNLSFATTARYTTAQSPSAAAGYQGCQVAPTNFSVSMKRTNFTPNVYQIDLTGLDDNLVIIVNGVSVVTKGCCTTPPATVNNIYTLALGATDQVELRWTQLTGPSQLGLNFTVVTPTPLAGGAVAANQSVCYGEAPAAGFTSTAPASGGCSLTGYQWQLSIDSVTWVTIAGATALTYTETAPLTQTQWYRRVASDACSNSTATVPVKVSINVVPPGNPAVFGDNVWNVYLYQFVTGQTLFSQATYKGYYIEPSLSFTSTSRWANGTSPSAASGYQGCYVAPTNHWVVYKRTDFAPNIYQIDIPAHDDDAYLLINGIQVFVHNGCCDSHTNVWTGPLGPSDVIEYRVSQGGGGAYEALTLTPVTPLPLTGGAVTPSQTICAGNVPPTPMTQSVAPTGGCTVSSYQWQSSTDGVTWANISGATAGSYTITTSIYSQTLFRRVVYDLCGNSANSNTDTVYMNSAAPGDPTVYGNNVWNVYCYQDVNYSLYAGYYTEPLLTFTTTNRYPSTGPPSAASGYLGCQLINTYYSTSMKRTGFTAGTYQIDVTSDDDYNLIYINGTLVSSLNYPTIQDNVWTGTLGPTDQIEIRWRNNAGPGQTGVRFTLATATPLIPGSIAAYNPTLCAGDIPIINNVTLASGGCFVNYSWQSSTDGVTWTTIPGATGTSYTATVSPTVSTQYRRVATDICGATVNTAPVSFTQGAGSVGNPTVYGNGAWNVYAYDANGSPFTAATYLGYYTEPLLSFNSLNRWTSVGSPSDASGYQGCQVDQDNHWVSYRRTNFTPGTYQLDIPSHDDDVYLFINGSPVFTHVGCCDTHTNVWTGTLGATDKIEYRWREYNGGSNGSLNFTLVTPAVGVTGGTIAASQSICSNTAPLSLTTTAAAVSNCFVNYQWQSQANCTGAWTDISGATSGGYNPGVLSANTCFRRKATDACGAVAYSNTVTITIYSTTLTAGTIASNQTVCAGFPSATLTSTALPTGGDGNYVYQWQTSADNIGWTNISGATAATYSPGVLTATSYFRRTVTACGTANTASSASVLITVSPSTVIGTQPGNPAVCVNGNTTVSVTATGSGTLAYQWQVNTGSGWVNATNGATYSNVGTAILTITAATAAMNGYQYRVNVSGACNTATSAAGTLTVGTLPSITNPPAATTNACVGSTAIINLTASGSGLTYVWQQKIGAGAWTTLTNTGVYSGVNTNALTLTGVTIGMNGYNYQCIITSSCGGTVTSGTSVLAVVAAINNTITADQSVCSGMTAATLSGTGSSAYTYLWQTSTVSAASGFVNGANTNNAQTYNPNPIGTTTYYRRQVTNAGCSNTSNVVTVTYSAAPIAITTQPTNQAVCAGSPATYSVVATGPGTLTYLWYEYNGSVFTPITDGGIYSGSATSTLTLSSPTLAMNNYRYLVKIFASGCTANSLNSTAAFLTTNSAPTITSSNPDIITCSGSAIAINVNALGLGITYQWQLNTGSGWNNLSNFGAYSATNSNSLRVTGTTTAMTGNQFRCIVTGTCSPFTATSAVTNLTVNPAVANNSISNSQNLCAGTPVPFTGSTPTGGDGTYAYQWYLNTGSGYTSISGATSPDYASPTLSQTTQFIRNVTSATCATSSSVALTVTINPATSTTDPSDTAVCAGTNATFTVVATATNPSYQWQEKTTTGTFTNITNGILYTGALTATLTVHAPPNGMTGYQYRCIVSGNCVPAIATSNPATLTINPTAVITTQPSNVTSCSGSTVTFVVAATGSGATYQWQEKAGSGAYTNITDGGIYSGSSTPTLTLTGITTAMNTNKYVCVITVGTCPVTTLPASLTVNTQPSLVITNPAAVCAPATVNITLPAVTAGSNLAGGTLSYWTNPTTTTPVTAPAAINATGTYYIRVASSATCYDVQPVNVAVSALITNNTINASQNICAGAVPSPLTGLTPAGGNGTFTYQWQSSTDNITYADITGATGINYAPPALGSTIWYHRTAFSGACNNVSASVKITVVAYPVASISYSGSPYCATGTATVTQTGQTGGVYSAPTGLVIDATTGTIDLVASTAGTYIVSYAVSNGTCSSTPTTSVTIRALPTATISYGASPYCATGTALVTFTGLTGGVYSAAAGLSLNSGTGAVNLNTSTPATYLVTYTVSNASGCTYSTTASITVIAQPVVVITNPAAVCAPATVDLTAAAVTSGSSTGLTYTYFTDAAATIALTTPSAVATGATYYIKGTNSNGCFLIRSVIVVVNPLPAATIAYPGSPYCGIGTAAVTPTGQTGGTYSSTTGLVINASTGAVNLATSTPGIYTVTYSFTNGTCPATTTTGITINQQPLITVTNPAAVCAPLTVDITAASVTAGTTPAGLTFTYFTDAAATNPLATPAAITASGTYYIKGTTASGCTDVKPVSVTVNPLSVASISYPASPYCGTGTAAVTRTGQTGGTYSSTSGLVINSATGAVNLATSTPGAYVVTYNFTNGTCPGTTTATITINQQPVITVTNPAAVCAPLTVDITTAAVTSGTTPTGLIFTYFTDAAATNSLATPTAIAASGTYYIKGTTASGCSDVKPVTVTVNPFTPASISYTGSPYCGTGTAAVTRTGQTGGTYSSTTGLVINAATGAINLTTSVPGSYTITYSFTNGTCPGTATAGITINPQAVITVTNPAAVCAPLTVDITAAAVTTGTTPAGLTFSYFTDAAATNPLTTPNAIAASGTYYIKGTTASGCIDVKPVTVTVNPFTAATISYAASPYCGTGTATVTRTGQAGGTYSSTTGLVITPATGAVNLATSTPGTYVVTYSFTNGTCPGTTTAGITINQQPLITVSNPAAVCAPVTVDLTAAAVTAGTTPTGLAFTYFTDAATTNPLTTPAAITASGTYYIKGTTASGCTDVKPVTVTVNPFTAASISYSGSPYCGTGTATVSQTGQTGGTYSSTTGLVINATSGAVNLATSTPGTYLVTYNFTNGTCPGTTTAGITINQQPVISIANPSPVCAPLTVDITAAAVTAGTTPSGLTFTYFTDAAASNPVPAPAALTVSGIYYIKGTTAAGCVDIKAVTVTINPQPVASITYAGSPYCGTGTATVTQTGQGGGTYSSTTGLVINSATGDLTLGTSTPGTYIVTYSFTNGVCPATTTGSVTISGQPVIAVTSPAPVCAPLTVDITAAAVTAGTTPAGLTYTYYQDAAALNVLTNPTAVSLSGTYYIKAVTSGGCSDVKPVTVTINALPVATIAYNGSPYCTNGAAAVSLSGQTGGTFSSTTGLSLDASTGAINLNASSEGTYTVQYVFSNAAGCSSNTSATVQIQNPVLVIHSPAGVCAPGTIDLTNAAVTAGSAAGLTFDYFEDAAGTTPVLNPSAISTSGTFYIRGTNTVTGCSTDILPVTTAISAKPPVSAAASGTDICKGSAVTLTGTSAGNSISWLNVSNSNPVQVTPLVTTTYYAVATTPDGCSDTASVVVAVKPFTLTLDATPNPVLAGDQVSVTTAANFSYTILSWSPAIFFDDQTALSQRITVRDTSKIFTVIAQSDEGCLDTANIKINIDPNLKDFFIPNAFSPNGDGQNDLFKVYGSSIQSLEMHVFNQWGELLYVNKDPQAGWDGTWKGRPQPVGPYFYEVKVFFYNNVTITRRGNISLIR